MKKIAAVILFITICTNAMAKCAGHAWLYVYSDSAMTTTYVSTSTQPVNAVITPDDWVYLKISGDWLCNSAVLLIHDADTLTNGLLPFPNSQYGLTTSATGHYYIHYVSTAADWTWEFDVSYSASTGTNTAAEIKPFQVYPSVSNGIYKVQTEQTLRQLLITDNEGRIVLNTSTGFSEIDLTKFSSGIYFYAITDEKENVWHGKLLKE